MKNFFDILIFGCGNIGSRHVQGLVKSKLNLNIYLYDIKNEAISSLINSINFNKFNKNKKKIIKIINFDFKKKFDLVIFANSSKNRFVIINNFLKKITCKRIIIEKIAFLNPIEYKKCIQLFKKNKIKSWINCNHQLFSINLFIKNKINNELFSNLLVVGGRYNLISNFIHYYMIFKFFNKKILVKKINTSLSEPFASKRNGYSEMYGFIEIIFNNNSKLIIIDHGAYSENVNNKIITNNLFFKYKEMSGNLIFNSKKKNYIKKFHPDNCFQSNLTHIVTEEIILKNSCSLPSIEETSDAHKVLYKILLNKLGKKKLNKLYFT